MLVQGERGEQDRGSDRRGNRRGRRRRSPHRDYLVARDALVAAPRAGSRRDAPLETDWRQAITDIVIPMLQGAAVETAIAAEKLALES